MTPTQYFILTLMPLAWIVIWWAIVHCDKVIDRADSSYGKTMKFMHLGVIEKDSIEYRHFIHNLRHNRNRITKITKAKTVRKMTIWGSSFVFVGLCVAFVITIV